MDKENSGSINTSGGTVIVASTGSNARIQVNTRHIGGITGADEADREKLKKLVAELNDQLKLAPPENRTDAEAVAVLTEDLVKKAAAEKPNKTLLRITADGVKEAAGALATVIPAAVKIVRDIADLVMGMPR